MNRRVIISIVLVAAIGFPALTRVFRRARVTVTLEKEQVQQALDARFPYKKGFPVASLKLYDPQVYLQDGSDRIDGSLRTEVELSLAGRRKTLTGSARISTKLDYDPADCRFYLVDPKLTAVEIQGASLGHTAAINRALETALKERIQRIPVYTITDDALKKRALRAVLKDVEIRNGRITATLGVGGD